MNQNKFDELYSELCNVVDKEMNKISGFDIPDEIPSTSPQARECVNRILEVLSKYGLDVESTADKKQGHDSKSPGNKKRPTVE